MPNWTMAVTNAIRLATGHDAAVLSDARRLSAEEAQEVDRRLPQLAGQ